MSGRFPYKERYKYPHMLGEDKDIWDRFIKLYPGRFDSVDYDFRVGDGIPYGPEIDPKTRATMKALTQKRIDVLGWNGEQPTIIEVKKRVGLSALGQVLGYLALFEADLPNILEPKLMIVTETIFRDDIRVLKGYNIEVVVC